MMYNDTGINYNDYKTEKRFEYPMQNLKLTVLYVSDKSVTSYRVVRNDISLNDSVPGANAYLKNRGTQNECTKLKLYLSLIHISIIIIDKSHSTYY